MITLFLALLGCAGTAASGPVAIDDSGLQVPVQQGALLLRGATLPGGTQATDVLVVDGRIAALGEAAEVDTGTTLVDLTGRWLAPSFIDSHVHLAYRPEGEELLRNGVIGAVDFAAPVAALATDTGSLRVRWSGPMITAEGGYPTRSWGQAGYGIEVVGAEQATDAVQTVADAGAGLVKLPLAGEPYLSEAELQAAVEAADAIGLITTTHALGDVQVLRAAGVGITVLGHTPTSAMGSASVSAFSDRVVVSTLAAFGGSAATVDNLRALHDAGATVLYGTDFGNTSDARIQSRELELLLDAGLSGAEILTSGTSAPAALWGFDDLGAIEVGKSASLLVLDADPHVDPLTLSRPVQVWVDGVAVN